MQTNRKKPLLAALTSCAMLFQTAALMPLTPAAAASVCTINTNKTYQMIQGFGGINHPEWTGYNLSDAEVQRAFGNGANELGLSILRIYVNDDSSQWNKAVPVAQKAQKLGALVFASPWNPPSSMRSGGSGGPRGGKYVLNSGAEAQYAAHLNSFVKYIEGQGVNLYSVSVQNEPDWSGDWTYWSPDRVTSFIANYGQTVTAGTSAMMMSAESFSYSKDYYTPILNNSKAFENCGVFGTHFYGTQRSNMDFPALESSGKPIWMTEVYCPDSSVSCEAYPQSLQQSENIHNGLVVGNMNAYVTWYIKRSYGSLNESGNISKRGYCLAQYSKYVRPGDFRIDATEQPDSNLLVSAFKHSDTQIEIVAINKGSSEVTQQFSVDNRNITNVNRYRTSANENIAETKGMEYSGSSFYASLPANSVSTFVVSLVSDGVELPENPNQPIVIEPDEPDADGYFFHDTFENGTCSWEGRGGAGINLGTTAYAGDKALAVTGREKQWHGAQKAINAATFTAGSEFSFSVCGYSSTEQTIMLSLQYTDASGETKYDHIAQAVSSGGYVQLANTNYKIPDGASSPVLYVETDGTMGDFFIDEAIGAPAGTKIDGPTAVQPAQFRLGDVNSDGKINGKDLTLAKRVYSGTLTDSTAKKAADVDQSGTVDADDLKYLRDFLITALKEFPVAEKPVPTVDFSAMEQKFGSVSLAKSYKAATENNPILSQYFGADPGVMEYDGRIYVYMTDDALLYENGSVSKNVYSKITHLRCISSDDLVNWTDHGLINAVGSGGAAKWAGNSWAPTACHKTINGKEKFFLYFANNANGIGVLTADSPTGPWTDPIGKALISRSTANCGSSDVVWLFDPAVLVDDDGKGYLYFGGGTEGKDSAHPKTSRCVQLGDDMTSIVGTPQTIDAPYIFEDSGIHKYGGKYYYSYCTNWNTGGNNLGLSTAAIDYMVSDSPLGPFTYKGEVFKNIGNFFGTTGNNHHTIIEFKGEFYLFYHAQYLQDQMGYNGLGYRTTHIDKITVNSDGTMKQVTGTKGGVSQIKSLDPFTEVAAATLSHQGGIEITGSGNTAVKAEKGDWFRVSGVDCKSASSITVKASSTSGSIIKVCTGSASGTAVAYIEIPAGSTQEIVAPVQGLSGKTDLYFVFNNAASMESWKLS